MIITGSGEGSHRPTNSGTRRGGLDTLLDTSLYYMAVYTQRRKKEETWKTKLK